MIPIASMFTLLCPSPALASVTSARATQQSDNVLRYNVRTITTEYATVAVRVWESGQAVTSGWTTEYTATNTTSNVVTVWGLKPSTRYNYRVLVQPASGAAYTYGNRSSFTTAALPASLPTLTATNHGGTSDWSFLLFDTRTTDTNAGAIVIADPTGLVRWYQIAPDGTETYDALYYSAEEAAIYAIADEDRIVRYEMDGSTTLDWSMADVLQDYVHHDLTVVDGVVYAIAARTLSYGGRDYVEEGIEGYDSAGNLVYEWWSSADGGMSPGTDVPATWARAGVGFWSSVFPSAIDWLHANSLYIRDEGGAEKAYVSFRFLNQVAKVDMATGVLEWQAGHANSSGANTNGDFTMASGGVSSSWWQLQHHAHFGDDGLLYIYDNGSGTSATRGIAVTLDESAHTVRIDRAVDFSDFNDNRFHGACGEFGSNFVTPADHLVLSCGDEAFFAEYDATDTLVWELVVGSTYTAYRGQPLDDIAL